MIQGIFSADTWELGSISHNDTEVTQKYVFKLLNMKLLQSRLNYNN